MTNADRQEILKKKDVERVAELSRLKLDDHELSKTAAQLERVLEYCKADVIATRECYKRLTFN